MAEGEVKELPYTVVVSKKRRKSITPPQLQVGKKATKTTTLDQFITITNKFKELSPPSAETSTQNSTSDSKPASPNTSPDQKSQNNTEVAETPHLPKNMSITQTQQNQVHPPVSMRLSSAQEEQEVPGMQQGQITDPNQWAAGLTAEVRRMSEMMNQNHAVLTQQGSIDINYLLKT